MKVVNSVLLSKEEYEKKIFAVNIEDLKGTGLSAIINDIKVEWKR